MQSQVEVSTLAGIAGTAGGFVDGTAAMFNGPNGIALGPDASFALVVSVLFDAPVIASVSLCLTVLLRFRSIILIFASVGSTFLLLL